MKIGLIVPGFSADADDWCIPVLVDVVRELSQRAEVHVFALRYPYRRGRFRLHGAEVHALGGGTATGLRRLGPLSAAWYRIAAEHRRGAFSILHGLWADEPGFIAVTAAQLLRIPSVVSVMGGELVAMPDISYGGYLARSNRLFASVALSSADCVTAGSSKAAELACSVLGTPRWRRGPYCEVQRLVWGVDPCHFKSHGQSRDLAGAERVLHVGSLVPVKDQAMLLRAMARLHDMHPGAHLHMVGEGPLQPELSKLASELGLASCVTFHGHVDRSQLGAYYRAADVVAVSSRYEAQLVVALEAALCGTPIVGTSVGLVADLAPDAAIAVPPGDDRALAGGMCAALEHDTGRCLGANAQRLALSRYLAAHTAGALISLYGNLERETRSE